MEAIMKNKPYCYDMGDGVIREKVYWGVPSFMGLPAAHNKKEIKGHEFAIMGAPWEGVCTYRGFGLVENFVKTVRYESERYGGYMPELDFDLFDYFSGVDYGDAAVKNGDMSFTFNSISQYLKDILEANAIPIIFGGDHVLSYPLIKTFAEHYEGNIGIIHFDAHLDNNDSFAGEKFTRCSPFNSVYSLPGFDPKNLVSVGIRGPRNHYNALNKAKEHGATVITSWDIKKNGLDASCKKAIDIATNGTKAFYVTVCSDVLDPSCNPGGAPDACGLTSLELGMILYECGLAGAKAFDYMEVFPNQDTNQVSSNVAVWMTLYIMNGMAKNMLKNKKK